MQVRSIMIGFVVILAAIPALACTCGINRRPTAVDALRWAPWPDATGTQIAAIFEGRVEAQKVETGSAGAPAGTMSMTPQARHRLVTFLISRTYRGAEQPRATVMTGLGGGDCGFDFETGEDYLVFATAAGSGLFTSICSPTELLEYADSALRFLRKESPIADDLVDAETYRKNFIARFFGQVCGRVTTSDGKPLARAMVDLTQIRNDGFEPETAGDPDLSKADGTFCILARAGGYLLTASLEDYDAHTRYSGYFPGVTKHADANRIEVQAGKKSNDVSFVVQQEKLYTFRSRVVMSNVGPLPWSTPGEHIAITLESAERGPLAYRLEQNAPEPDGYYRFNYVPPGRYTASIVLHRSYEEIAEHRPQADLSNWIPERREISIDGDTEIVLKLTPR